MNAHSLKIWPEFFEAVLVKEKNFEIRFNDRNFKVGDTLYLNEYNPDTHRYTGRKCERVICYITEFNQKRNYVVMGLVC